MAGGVEHRHKVIPSKLGPGFDGAQALRLLDQLWDIRDLEIKMQLFLLFAWLLRPDRADIARLLDEEKDDSVFAAHRRPAEQPAPFPAQEIGVKRLQFLFVLTIDHDVAQGDFVVHAGALPVCGEAAVFFFTVAHQTGIVKGLYCRIIRYPTPRWVWMYWGWLGSGSIFLRSVAMNTRREGVSDRRGLPHTSLRM